MGREGQGCEEIARNCEDWRLEEELTGNGGWWRRSARIRVREGLPVVRARGAVGERCGSQEGGQRGVGDGGADGRSGAF
jgi:hypothetical protein